MSLIRVVSSKNLCQKTFSFIYFCSFSFTANRIRGRFDRPEREDNNFINLLCQIFKAIYYAGQKIVIDESLVYFRGRQKMKFYLPSKPHKWVFKLHLLCDSDQNYSYDILLDPGKEKKNTISLENKL